MSFTHSIENNLIPLWCSAGISQDRIDECRGAKERSMLADLHALVQNGADLNAQDENGATLVKESVFFKLLLKQ